MIAKIFLFIGNLILFFCLYYLFICYVFMNPPSEREDSVLVETSYGDSFTILYTIDFIVDDCMVKDNNSDFFMTNLHDIKEKDIIELYCNSDLRIYQIDNKIIYNDGSGFKYFYDNENLLVKEIIDKIQEEK